MASWIKTVGWISSTSTWLTRMPQSRQTCETLCRIARLISSREASVSSRPMSPMIERSVVVTSFSTHEVKSTVA